MAGSRWRACRIGALPGPLVRTTPGTAKVGMTYDQARYEIEQGVISGRYTRTQGRRLRAAVRVLERYDRPLPIWSRVEDLASGADWAERIVEVSQLTDPLSPPRF